MHGLSRLPDDPPPRRKRVVTAYLLWLLLWWCGGHRFYAGRIVGGVITVVMLFGSLPFLIMGIGIFGYVIIAVWAVVDLALIPGWIREHNAAIA